MSFIYPDLDLVGVLMIKNIRIQNANAISSPISYGFPAITGFTGAIHALSRKINQVTGLEDVYLDGVIIGCHECIPQTYRESDYKDYTFNQTRNPILKSGKTSAIIEEGRCHLRVSLIIGVYSDDIMLEADDLKVENLVNTVKTKVQQQRIASGSVISLDRFEPVTFKPAEEINDFNSALLPAFVLMNAQNDLIDIISDLKQDDPNATALDALLHTATLTHLPIEDNDKTEWQVQSVKTGRGWLVPIPIGFQPISQQYEAGEMQNTRNPDYPSQYVETIYGLGKWVFPHRIDDLEKALWYQKYDESNDLYLVTQDTDL